MRSNGPPTTPGPTTRSATATSADGDDDRIVNIFEALLGGVPIDGRHGSPLKPTLPLPLPPNNGCGAD